MTDNSRPPRLTPDDVIDTRHIDPADDSLHSLQAWLCPCGSDEIRTTPTPDGHADLSCLGCGRYISPLFDMSNVPDDVESVADRHYRDFHAPSPRQS